MPDNDPTLTTRSARFAALSPIFAPRSVAIVGASDTVTKIGGIPVDFHKRLGFAGPIYPVKGSLIQGLPAYPVAAGDRRTGRRGHFRDTGQPGAVCAGGCHCRRRARRGAVHLGLRRDQPARCVGAGAPGQHGTGLGRAPARPELPGLHEHPQRRLRHLLAGAQCRPGTARAYRPGQPVRRLRWICLFDGARTRHRPVAMDHHRQRGRPRFRRRRRVAGAGSEHPRHHGLHGGLPRRLQAAPRAGRCPRREEAGGDRQGRSHRDRRPGGRQPHRGAGRRRRGLRRGVPRIRRAPGARRRRILRHRGQRQLRDAAAGPLDRPVHALGRCRRADGRRSPRQRPGRASHAAAGAGHDPQLGAVRRPRQPGGHHRPGHQRPDTDRAHSAADAGRRPLRQLGRLPGRRWNVQRVLAGDRAAGGQPAARLSRQAAGAQHLADCRATPHHRVHGLPGVQRTGRSGAHDGRAGHDSPRPSRVPTCHRRTPGSTHPLPAGGPQSEPQALATLAAAGIAIGAHEVVHIRRARPPQPATSGAAGGAQDRVAGHPAQVRHRRRGAGSAGRRCSRASEFDAMQAAVRTTHPVRASTACWWRPWSVAASSASWALAAIRCSARWCCSAWAVCSSNCWAMWPAFGPGHAGPGAGHDPQRQGFRPAQRRARTHTGRPGFPGRQPGGPVATGGGGRRHAGQHRHQPLHRAAERRGRRLRGRRGHGRRNRSRNHNP